MNSIIENVESENNESVVAETVSDTVAETVAIAKTGSGSGSGSFSKTFNVDVEILHNKNDGWNKMSKTIKLRMLYSFADKYGKQNNYIDKDVTTLKAFFQDSLEKSKLQKTKDVIFNKVTQEITSIPALTFNAHTRNFTLRVMDPKRVSTVKSLTPKKMIKIESDGSIDTLLNTKITTTDKK